MQCLVRPKSTGFYCRPRFSKWFVGAHWVRLPQASQGTLAKRLGVGPRREITWVDSCRFKGSASHAPARCKTANEIGSHQLIQNRRGLKLYVRNWEVPQGTAKLGNLLMVHGFSWHSGYFEELAIYLTKAGFSVKTYDLQGHGLSESLDGIRGYVEAFSEHVDDTEDALQQLRMASPGLPTFIFGESMGGLLVLLLTLTRPEAVAGIAGLILSAPVVRVAPSVVPPPPVLALLRLLAKPFPKVQLPTNELRDTYMSAFGDQEVARRSLNDPLVLFERPCLRFIDEVFAATESIASQLEDLRLPFLVMHGLDDTRTEPQNSEELVRRAQACDKTLQLYPGMKHQLLQEVAANKAVVFEDVRGWMLAHVGQASHEL